MASSSAGLGVGAMLILSEVRWFRRVPLARRLEPPQPQHQLPLRARLISPTMAAEIGDRVATAFGLDQELGTRLDRLGRRQSEAQYRARQASMSAAALLISFAALLWIGIALIPALLIGAGFTIATFLAPERLLAQAIAARGAGLTEELPTITEQIAMLLASGMSLTNALATTGQRGQGICCADLRRVSARVAGGATVETALEEWAETAGSSDVRRLVGVLTLHEDTADIAALVSDEARSARAAAHRRLIERIERRNEQVWIPVTVAALVPGAVLLSIPFSDALRSYTGV
ncbi:type II secretion system F family protein [Candidatus Poriferisodalis sp.]|uniref:type II secretion system F family protein n=1 Tax=Candidatus Poriferisodalis sp. TaxID=3101277 RepID=UPI003D099B10